MPSSLNNDTRQLLQFSLRKLLRGHDTDDSKEGDDEIVVKDDQVIVLFFGSFSSSKCRDVNESFRTLGSECKEKPFQIIYVSSDDSAYEFDRHCMKWYLVPFEKKVERLLLFRHFRVNSIPTIVCVDANGAVITNCGVENLATDPTGNNFPWAYPSLAKVLGSKFIKMKSSLALALEDQDTDEEAKQKFQSNVSLVDLSSFEGLLVLYFCADWCEACKLDEPYGTTTSSESALLRLYERKRDLAERANCKDIEIIQLSADDNDKQFMKFFSKKLWLSIPFQEQVRIKNIFDRFNVTKIPHIAIVKVSNGNMTTVNPNAVTDLLEKSDFATWPYEPSPITDISKSLDSYGFNINERPSLVLLMETSNSDSIKTHVYESLLPLAKILSTNKIDDVEGPRILFFQAFEESAQANKIRELCKLPKIVSDEESLRPIALILDFNSGGAFYVKDFQQEEREHVILDRLQRAAEKGSVKFDTVDGDELQESRSALTFEFSQFIKDYESMKLQAKYIL